MRKRRFEKIYFKKDGLRKTFWERRCENDVVRKTLWERRCEKAVTKSIKRKTLWERRCEKNIIDWDVVRDIAWITLWERRCEKDVVRKTFWERRCEKDVMRKTLWERRCARDVVLSLMERLLQLIYWYTCISLGNVEFGPLLKLFFFIFDILCMQIGSLFPRKISISTDHSAVTNCWSPRGIQGHWPSSFC